MKNLVRTSRLRVGRLQTRGIPAILLGVAGVVMSASALILAAGTTRALAASAPTLPDTIRELRILIESNRRSRPLNP